MGIYQGTAKGRNIGKIVYKDPSPEPTLPRHHSLFFFNQSISSTRDSMKVLTIPILFAATAHALSTPMSDPSGARSINPGADFKGGAGVGRLVFDSDGTPVEAWSCTYDMVLVERLQDRSPTTDDGLFVPRENLPTLHLCKGE